MVENLYNHTKENPHLLGHTEAERILVDSYNSGKLHHAWLISGLRGIGKANLAYRFARFLLAGEKREEKGLLSLFGGAQEEESSSLYLPPEHNVFRRVAAGSHSDLLAIELNEENGSKEITVDKIREISHFLRLTPAESAWRIVIIDSADDMNRNAANAMLKILEEPPPNTVILLVSHVTGRLLPTIHSRCRNLRLSPLSNEEVTKILASIQPDLIKREAEFASMLSHGSPGFALELYNHGGLDLYHHIINIMKTLPDINIVALQDFGTKLAGKKANTEWRIATYMLTHFLGRTVKSLISHHKYEEFIEGEREVSDYLARYYSVASLTELWERIAQISAETEGLNMDRKLAVMQLFGSFRKAA